MMMGLIGDKNEDDHHHDENGNQTKGPHPPLCRVKSSTRLSLILFIIVIVIISVFPLMGPTT